MSNLPPPRTAPPAQSLPPGALQPPLPAVTLPPFLVAPTTSAPTTTRTPVTLPAFVHARTGSAAPPPATPAPAPSTSAAKPPVRLTSSGRAPVTSPLMVAGRGRPAVRAGSVSGTLQRPPVGPAPAPHTPPAVPAPAPAAAPAVAAAAAGGSPPTATLPVRISPALQQQAQQAQQQRRQQAAPLPLRMSAQGAAAAAHTPVTLATLPPPPALNLSSLPPPPPDDAALASPPQPELPSLVPPVQLPPPPQQQQVSAEGARPLPSPSSGNGNGNGNPGWRTATLRPNGRTMHRAGSLSAATNNPQQQVQAQQSLQQQQPPQSVALRKKAHEKPERVLVLGARLSARRDAALYARNAVDRGGWRRQVLLARPHIAELRERVQALPRAAALCRTLQPGAADVKACLGPAQVLQLVLQHLHVRGFRRARRVLEAEAQVRLAPAAARLHTSRLAACLRRAMRDVDRLYDALAGARGVHDARRLDECVAAMDLREDARARAAADDVNIWDEAGEAGAQNIILVRTSGSGAGGSGSDGLCGGLGLGGENENGGNGNTAGGGGGEEEGRVRETVRAGSLNKLVEKLTDDTLLFDATYIPTFMMTYPTFATPAQLLEKLCERFDVPARVPAAEAHNIQMRVCKVMKKWMETCPADFDDEHLRVRMRAFIDAAAQQTSPFVALVDGAFRRMLAAARTHTVRLGTPREPVLPPDFLAHAWDAASVLALADDELARQLTVLDARTFARIRPAELLDCAWSKPRLRARAPHVLAMIRAFNAVSGWVVAAVVRPPTVRERAAVMAKFVRIAQHLADMHNYNALTSILSGLNSSAVSRLRFTAAEMAPALQRQRAALEALMSSDNNFHAYRAVLLNIEDKVPTIPYLGVCLTDLTFCEENSDYINGLINFAKRSLVYQIIHDLLKRQDAYYSIQPVHQILQVFYHLPPLDEQEYYALSLKREPRGCQRANIL